MSLRKKLHYTLVRRMKMFIVNYFTYGHYNHDL